MIGEKKTEFFEMGNDFLNEHVLTCVIDNYCKNHYNVKKIKYVEEDTIRYNLKNNTQEFLNKKVVLHSNFHKRKNNYKKYAIDRCEKIGNKNVTVQELYDLKLNIGGSETKVKRYTKCDLIYDVCNRKLLELE